MKANQDSVGRDPQIGFEDPVAEGASPGKGHFGVLGPEQARTTMSYADGSGTGERVRDLHPAKVEAPATYAVGRRSQGPL